MIADGYWQALLRAAGGPGISSTSSPIDDPFAEADAKAPEAPETEIVLAQLPAESTPMAVSEGRIVEKVSAAEPLITTSVVAATESALLETSVEAAEIAIPAALPTTPAATTGSSAAPPLVDAPSPQALPVESVFPAWPAHAAADAPATPGLRVAVPLPEIAPQITPPDVTIVEARSPAMQAMPMVALPLSSRGIEPAAAVPVTLSIGRVEVRVTPPAATAAPPPRRRPAAGPPLADYLAGQTR